MKPASQLPSTGLVLAIALLASPWLAAQQLDTSKLGSGYAHLLGFASEPEVSASSINVENDDPRADDRTLRGIRLPYYKSFDVDGRDWSWFVQSSLGYLKVDESATLELIPGEPFTTEPEWTAVAGLLEAGLVYPLGGGFSISPSISGGLSRLENTMEFSSEFYEDLFRPTLDGKLYNWSTNATIARAHLALRYDQKYGHYRVKSAVHLTYARVSSYNESRDFAGFSGDSGTAIFQIDVSRRINSASADTPVFLIGHLANTSFLGSSRSDLNFKYFNEVGVSLGRGPYTLGVLSVFGEGVEGWNLILNYDY